ncbi:MAG TPA: gfo/Idh/MocA family oxidoreductase, partial [Bryobacteraceae bacterium]
LRYWKDGRDVPDVMLALFDYPEGFNLSLRVNFVDGGQESEGLTFTGSEGTIEIAGNSVTVNRVPSEKAPGLSIGTFTKEMQKRIEAAYAEKYPAAHSDETALGFERFSAPEHYSDSYDHLRNFFASVRSRQPVTEDPVFGFRAAGAALLSNVSYEEDRIVHWNPEKMEMRSHAASI